MAIAQSTLVKNYLREATAQAGSVVADQLVWLEAKRVELSAEVDGGDWALTSGSFSGRGHSASRGISAAARLSAVMAAMEKLEGGRSSNGVMLHPHFQIDHG